MYSTRLHRLGAARAKRPIAKNFNEIEISCCRGCLTEPDRRPMATRAVSSPLVAGCQTPNRAVTGVPRDGASNKKPYGLKALGAWGNGKTNSQFMDVILMVHCNRPMLRRTTKRDPQPAIWGRGHEKSLRLLPWQVRLGAASSSVQELLFADVR